MKNNTYKIEVICKKCPFKGIINVPKGQTIEEIKCPTCGLQELRKKRQIIKSKPLQY